MKTTSRKPKLDPATALSTRRSPSPSRNTISIPSEVGSVSEARLPSISKGSTEELCTPFVVRFRAQNHDVAE